jgi:molybdopterin-synthase adenylyltransferase
VLYLALPGVGRITVADSDRGDLTNLQRQIAHDTDRIGMNKAESAARRKAAINPEIAIFPLVG